MIEKIIQDLADYFIYDNGFAEIIFYGIIFLVILVIVISITEYFEKKGWIKK